MRGGQRRHRHEEEEESVFVSMTDMTVSFLFIVMILLAFFAKRFVDSDTVPKKQYDYIKIEHDRLFLENEQNKKSVLESGKEIKLRDRIIAAYEQRIISLENEIAELKKRLNLAENEIFDIKIILKIYEERIITLENEIVELKKRINLLENEIVDLKMRLTIKNPLEIYISDVAKQRIIILNEIKRRIDFEFPELQVSLSQEKDALRFEGDGLFNKGVTDIKKNKIEVVKSIARIIDDVLPCYTYGIYSKWDKNCNSAGVVIEAIQIEGHTDSDGFEINNLILSTQRANQTFFTMTAHIKRLVEHKNLRDQPVLSVAGYGQMRPAHKENTEEAKTKNRRIDIRIIMYIPTATDEIMTIKEKLTQGIVQQVKP
jgi:flagellar motor protein MotB